MCHFSANTHFSAVVSLYSLVTLWDQPAIDRSWSTDAHRKACLQVSSSWAADCQIIPVDKALLTSARCALLGTTCQGFVQTEWEEMVVCKKCTDHKFVFFHACIPGQKLFWIKKTKATFLIWVQTVQMASVFMMSISGLALGREHLLIGAECLSLAWQEYT